MSDPTYPLFPVLSFLAFILVLLPLPWHFQAWNAGTCLYMIWAALACLNQFVNSIIWHGNALNPVPVWCDISTRIMVGSSVAIPCASLCINRRLYKIATASTLNVTRKDKRRAVLEDVAIGVGIPVVQMLLQLVVEAHRFDIFEDLGCFPVTYNVWLAYLLSATWPVVIGLVSGVYCVLTLRAFMKRSAQFNELLANSSSSLTKYRYLRLMALAATDLCCTTPFAAYSIYLNLTTQPLNPYRGWDDLHFNYSRVDQIPSTLWHLNHQMAVALELNRWLVVACAFVFFAFFGFADEARRNYKMAFWTVAKRLGFKQNTLHNRNFNALPFGSSEKKKKVPGLSSSGGLLPVFIARPRPSVPRDSFLSTDPSMSNEKLVRSESVSAPSTRLSASTTTLTLPPLSKSETKDTESPYSECFGHAY